MKSEELFDGSYTPSPARAIKTFPFGEGGPKGRMRDCPKGNVMLSHHDLTHRFAVPPPQRGG